MSCGLASEFGGSEHYPDWRWTTRSQQLYGLWVQLLGCHSGHGRSVGWRVSAQQITMEQDENSLQRMRRSREISSFSTVVEELTHKHSLDPDHLTPGEKDSSLTIEDMSGKLEIMENLQSNLLPLFKGQLTPLLNSLDLIDPKKNPEPEINPTAKLLSNLDETLKSIVSSVVSLTLKSPLPDEKYDHGLENLKVFRCSHLKRSIRLLVGVAIYDKLFRHLSSFIQHCSRVYLANEDSRLSDEGSNLRRELEETVLVSHGVIRWIIGLCQESDWAMVLGAWRVASYYFDQLLVSVLASQTRFMIHSTSEADPNENPNLDERNVLSELMAEILKSTVPLVKLGRILIVKTSETIRRKSLSALRRTELNSETMNQLEETPQLILKPLKNLSNILQRSPQRFSVDDQNAIRNSVRKLPADMESTLRALDSLLIPFLPQSEDETPACHLKSFFPTFEQSWNRASDNLMHVISSFEVQEL
ncbi:hypothetical protein PTTG_12560 [Puccinia triticina 1-1 BBBD Race 1]|uniref:Uncharacterized protein n=1 Tax=Puccinia triticina (isolate 1-1 / race 1 (BBBD)) TaxID=630390 RepID=A0A180GLC3_PUCT1|nr:hypothetical protein PTTG_12560 [Puccinia triticina 1-1 BBBD Race 1]